MKKSFNVTALKLCKYNNYFTNTIHAGINGINKRIKNIISNNIINQLGVYINSKEFLTNKRIE